MSELSRLEWRCRRGTKELDLLMMGYLKQFYEHAEPRHQQGFQRLLEMQDPELYELLTGRSESDDRDIAGVVAIIRKKSSD